MESLVGLSEQDAAVRRRRGEGNSADTASFRGHLRILRANLFTFFNNILFVIGIALLALDRPGDAFTSVGIGLLSAIVSTAQEVRGKRKLDSLRVVDSAEVTVVRDGVERRVGPAEVVRGDLLRVGPGEQVVVDGPLVHGGPLAADESLLTGESDLVVKHDGDVLLSGSSVASGDGYQRAENVGADSYASTLAAAARVHTQAKTPLQSRVDFVVRLIMVVVALMSGAILLQAALDGETLVRFVQTTAVLSGLVPYGLFLLITVAYTVGAARIGRRGVVVQRVSAVEAICNVDVLCMDKTGTLTSGRLQLAELEVLPGIDPLWTKEVLGGLARIGSSADPTVAALVDAFPDEPLSVREQVPFSPATRWSAAATYGKKKPSGVFVLGAFDALAERMPAASVAGDGPLAGFVDDRSARGMRVLVLARAADAEATLYDAAGVPALPPLVPCAAVALRDELRDGVVEAVAQLRAQEVTVKVLSGDDPRTVAALAAQAGLDVAEPITGEELERLSPAQFDEAVATHGVFGRMSPEHKERVVTSLRDAGHYVAMIGDGINDVRALKRAQVAVAMRSGSQVARDVADIVLADDSFEALLPAQREGRTIISGIVTAMHLFLTRVATATIIIAAVTMLGLGFPYEPAQVGLTLFTVGVPSFFLSMWARPRRPDPQLLSSLARFVFPAAITCAIGAVGVFTYLYTIVEDRAANNRMPAIVITEFETYSGLASTDSGFADAAATVAAQTGLSIFVSLSGILLILFMKPPHRVFAAWTAPSPDRRPVFLVLGLLVTFLVVILTPAFADYFQLVRPIGPVADAVPIALAAWFVVLWAAYRWNILDRLLGLTPHRPSAELSITR